MGQTPQWYKIIKTPLLGSKHKEHKANKVQDGKPSPDKFAISNLTKCWMRADHQCPDKKVSHVLR